MVGSILLRVYPQFFFLLCNLGRSGELNFYSHLLFRFIQVRLSYPHILFAYYYYYYDESI